MFGSLLCVSVLTDDDESQTLQIRDIWEGSRDRGGECTYTLLTRASTGGTAPLGDTARVVVPFSRGWWR